MTVPAIVAGFLYTATIDHGLVASERGLVAMIVAGLTYVVLNNAFAALVISLRAGGSARAVYLGNLRSFGLPIVGLAPLSWLMAIAYAYVGPGVALIFALPLYTTRAAYASVVEIRDMFTQTVKALASAIDARDPSTAKHSEWVSTIAVDIGKRMGCGETQLEQLEWAGLLHDVGKIGIPDAILLKAGPLDKEERLVMNRHPEKGEEILVGVKKLRPELTVIRHHHEWFNGSGYPDRLIGEEIPLLARIMHLADGYEAMTRSRPYRPIPLTHDQAVAEIVKFSGIQFDPRIVEVFLAIDFSETEWARVDRDALKAPTHQPPSVPMLADAAKRGTAARATSTVVETP
ncbi:MAG: HD domain-containing phosphohydrolase [Candidatus Limnocylindrales bacterium]